VVVEGCADIFDIPHQIEVTSIRSLWHHIPPGGRGGGGGRGGRGREGGEEEEEEEEK